jgi:hypothetical protein
MNDGLALEQKGKWSRCMIPFGHLTNKKQREKLIGGAMRQCHKEVRRPGMEEIKVHMTKWMLIEHGSSITNEEFKKYLPIL